MTIRILSDLLAPLRALVLACAILAVMPGPGAAQDPAADATIDYTQWETLAGSAEEALEEASLSTADFEALRAEIATSRSRFLDAQSQNADRIDTIEAQIEALGPAPEDGATEPPSVADRRAELETLLAEARAPGRAAAEAFNRADGLIGEIDTLIRERETEALFEAGPSPLVPSNWRDALASLSAVAEELVREVRARTAFDLRRQAIRDTLPVALLLGAAGLLLLLRGRSWMLRATDAVARRAHSRGRLTLAFLVSFTQLLVPALGLILLAGAVISTGILGPNGLELLEAGIGVILTVFLSLWLAGRLFPEDDDVPTTLPLQPERRPAGRRLTVAIGAVVGLTGFVETLAGLPQVTPAAQGVLVLPLYLIQAFQFYRASSLFRDIRQNLEDEDESQGFRKRLLAIITPVLRLIAVAGPVLAAAGYFSAAERLMVPTALTLGVLGILQALQVPIRDTYAAIARSSYDDASQALVPVLVNLALLLLVVPVVLLIWGMRSAELLEVYARFNEGFSLGEARITPGTILSVVIVFVIGLLVTRLIQGALKTTVLPRTSMDTGARNAISAGVGYVGIALAALIAINAGGIDLTAIAFVLSALSVGIGFGLQNVVSNFVSGIILLIERPISEGDWIEVNGQMGIVKDISVRSTRIETFDKTDVIVPNADFISGTVTNWTRGNNIGRAVLTVGVAYGTDTRRVQAILEEIASGHEGVAAYPPPGVDFLGFGADSLDFRIRAILRDVNTLVPTKTEINHQIAERFAAEGIEIPFAQRDIWLRNPETLRGEMPAAGPGPDASPEEEDDR